MKFCREDEGGEEKSVRRGWGTTERWIKEVKTSEKENRVKD
jgi:hypothetical protein